MIRLNKISLTGGLIAGALLILVGAFVWHYTNATQAEQADLVQRIVQSLVQEIQAKSFDERTVTGPVFGEQWLTPPDQLGPDDDSERISLPDTIRGGTFASRNTFNDIDDYDGYSRRIVTARGDTILLTVRISYLASGATVATQQTLTKGVRITVGYEDANRYSEQLLVVNY